MSGWTEKEKEKIKWGVGAGGGGRNAERRGGGQVSQKMILRTLKGIPLRPSPSPHPLDLEIFGRKTSKTLRFLPTG